MNIKFATLVSFLRNRETRFRFWSARGVYNCIPDEKYVKKEYETLMGSKLNLDLPITFNEKMQWLKLYDHNPVYTKMVDKHEVKKYVSKIIGENYIIKTIGIWNSFDEINFDELPEQFVLKCTHDSGGIVICKDKKTFNKRTAKKILDKYMKRNYYLLHREWPYKNVEPRIIAETYMTDNSGELCDYKIFNFNGMPKLILVCRDRFKESGLTEDFYSEKWVHLDVKRPNLPNAEEEMKRPKELEEMLELSKILSKDIPFLRTDFYVIEGKVYFGELTFYPASGLSKFEPDEYDTSFGEWIKLPD